MEHNTRGILPLAGAALLLIAVAILFAVLPDYLLSMESHRFHAVMGPAELRAEWERVAAPDFTVTAPDGSEIPFSQWREGPVVVLFWAGWSEPCEKALAAFQSVYERQGQDVCFLAVNLTDGVLETRAAALDYIEERGYTFPVCLDVEQQAALAYRVREIPAVVFINSRGRIVGAVAELLSEEALLAGLSAAF